MEGIGRFVVFRWAFVGGGLWGFTRDEDAIGGSAELEGRVKGSWAPRAKVFVERLISTSPRRKQYEFICDWENVGNLYRQLTVSEILLSIYLVLIIIFNIY